jgi:uncharacterized membrane protein YfcA
MSLLEAAAILLAGAGAGMINTVVGSGSLITFPVLLAFGYAPVVANVSNNIGIAAGGISGVHGYRRELVGQRARIVGFGIASALGGVTGAALLLALPDSVFEAVVPTIIALALVLVVIQPWIARALAHREVEMREHRSPWARLAIYLSGIYGGYFGAAQGVLLLGILGVALPDHLQRVNALKNVLAMVVNLVAAAIFVVAAPVAWGPAALIAVGSIAGAQLGARTGRRLPPSALRAVIVVVGIAAIVRLLT